MKASEGNKIPLSLPFGRLRAGSLRKGDFPTRGFKANCGKGG